MHDEVVVAPRTPVQVRQARPQGIKYTKYRISDLSLKDFHQRVFHENGDVTLRRQIDLGKGYRFPKSEVDNWLHDKDGNVVGRDEFVALLKRILAETHVEEVGTQSPDQQPAHLATGGQGRPHYSKAEKKKRKIKADAATVRGARKRYKKSMEEAVACRKEQETCGLFVCWNQDENKTSFCIASPFGTEAKWRNHKCKFSSQWSNADELKRKFGLKRQFGEMQYNSNSSSSAVGHQRVAAAEAEEDDNTDTVAADGTYFALTLSDASKQNVSHLVVHRMASLQKLKRIDSLANHVLYTNKTDGAANYTSAVSWFALRVLHEVNETWPRCKESLTSQSGDGKSGNDRFHAELARKKAKELQKGMDQTDARSHALAVVKDGGCKASVVAVVTVPRNDDTSFFQDLDVKQPSSAARGPPPKKASGPPLEHLSCDNWVNTRFMANVKKISYSATPEQQALAIQFVDACFAEGTNATEKVRPCLCQQRMSLARHPSGGHKFGPGTCFTHGPVWSEAKIQGRYSALLDRDKNAPHIRSDASRIDFMTKTKSGCGKTKVGLLKACGITTLGSLLQFAESGKDAIATTLKEKNSKLKPQNILDFAQRLKTYRNGNQ